MFLFRCCMRVGCSNRNDADHDVASAISLAESERYRSTESQIQCRLLPPQSATSISAGASRGRMVDYSGCSQNASAQLTFAPSPVKTVVNDDGEGDQSLLLIPVSACSSAVDIIPVDQHSLSRYSADDADTHHLPESIDNAPTCAVDPLNNELLIDSFGKDFPETLHFRLVTQDTIGSKSEDEEGGGGENGNSSMSDEDVDEKTSAEVKYIADIRHFREICTSNSIDRMCTCSSCRAVKSNMVVAADVSYDNLGIESISDKDVCYSCMDLMSPTAGDNEQTEDVQKLTVTSLNESGSSSLGIAWSSADFNSSPSSMRESLRGVDDNRCVQSCSFDSGVFVPSLLPNFESISRQIENNGNGISCEEGDDVDLATALSEDMVMSQEDDVKEIIFPSSITSILHDLVRDVSIDHNRESLSCFRPDLVPQDTEGNSDPVGDLTATSSITEETSDALSSISIEKRVQQKVHKISVAEITANPGLFNDAFYGTSPIANHVTSVFMAISNIEPAALASSVTCICSGETVNQDASCFDNMLSQGFPTQLSSESNHDDISVSDTVKRRYELPEFLQETDLYNVQSSAMQRFEDTDLDCVLKRMCFADSTEINLSLQSLQADELDELLLPELSGQADDHSAVVNLDPFSIYKSTCVARYGDERADDISDDNDDDDDDDDDDVDDDEKIKDTLDVESYCICPIEDVADGEHSDPTEHFISSSAISASHGNYAISEVLPAGQDEIESAFDLIEQSGITISNNDSSRVEEDIALAVDYIPENEPSDIDLYVDKIIGSALDNYILDMSGGTESKEDIKPVEVKTEHQSKAQDDVKSYSATSITGPSLLLPATTLHIADLPVTSNESTTVDHKAVRKPRMALFDPSFALCVCKDSLSDSMEDDRSETSSKENVAEDAAVSVGCTVMKETGQEGAKRLAMLRVPEFTRSGVSSSLVHAASSESIMVVVSADDSETNVLRRQPSDPLPRESRKHPLSLSVPRSKSWSDASELGERLRSPAGLVEDFFNRYVVQVPEEHHQQSIFCTDSFQLSTAATVDNDSETPVFYTEPVSVSDNDLPNLDESPQHQHIHCLSEQSTPPHSPSSSLLKTQSATVPRHRKKSVHFADTVGLELASVHQFQDTPDEPPASLEEFLKKLAATADRRSRWTEHHPRHVTTWPTEARSSLFIRFQLPDNPSDLVEKVLRCRVTLESCCCDDLFMTVSGVVRVANITFQKSVFIRYTFDGWSTHTDLDCQYVPLSNDGTTDRFAFTIILPSKKTFMVGSQVEFAICYTIVGDDGASMTFWDSNDGRNYIVEYQLVDSGGSTETLGSQNNNDDEEEE